MATWTRAVAGEMVGGGRILGREVLETRFSERGGGLDIDAVGGRHTGRPSRLLVHSTGCSNAGTHHP